jgi:hypothetical protein
LQTAHTGSGTNGVILIDTCGAVANRTYLSGKDEVRNFASDVFVSDAVA